jgi:hypothetical protein
MRKGWIGMYCPCVLPESLNDYYGIIQCFQAVIYHLRRKRELSEILIYRLYGNDYAWPHSNGMV